MQKLTAYDLDSFYIDLKKADRADGKPGKISPYTIKHIHDIISAALSRAIKWADKTGLIRNVAISATPPEVPTKRPTSWTPEQAAAFLETVRHDKFYAAYLLAIQAGLRRGEILGLRWCDINFKDRSVFIEQTLVKTSEGDKLKPPKTKDSQSPTALSPATVKALRERMLAQARERREWEAKCGPGTWEDNGLVFTQEDGSRLKPDSFSRLFKKRLGKGGIPRIRFHDQRHTAATLMVNSGADIKIVSDQLRHANISTTADMYVGPIPAAQRRAADAMDDTLGLTGTGKAGSPKDPQNVVQ